MFQRDVFIQEITNRLEKDKNIFFRVVRLASEYFSTNFFITLSFLDKYFFALFQYKGVLLNG